MTIALDAMGGDYGPSVTVPAALNILKKYLDLHLILVGNPVAMEPYLTDPLLAKRLTIRPATQQVDNDEPPARALRFKKDSSMRVAIDLVKEGVAKACVSAGNTGALMATAHYVLKTLEGVDRPAIMAKFPTRFGLGVRLLDLGANIDADANNLYQFAVMGSIVANLVSGIAKPRVGLLNVGAEAIKGKEQVKQAAVLLQNCPVMEYIGYVEGDDIFKEVADIIVCDGFVGNITLKACEGSSKLISAYLREAFHQNIFSRMAGLIAKPILSKVARGLDPSRFNGASFLGLRGIVIKSHGGANISAFERAIEEAISEVISNIPQRISQEVATLLQTKIPSD